MIETADASQRVSTTTYMVNRLVDCPIQYNASIPREMFIITIDRSDHHVTVQRQDL